MLSEPWAQGDFILSEHLSQDPLEGHFGRQRSRGGRSDNQTVAECLKNVQSLRLQGSISQLPTRGNSSRKGLRFPVQIVDDTPLPKRSRDRSIIKGITQL